MCRAMSHDVEIGLSRSPTGTFQTYQICQTVISHMLYNRLAFESQPSFLNNGDGAISVMRVATELVVSCRLASGSLHARLSRLQVAVSLSAA